jgi:hypothetical protein
MNTHAHFLQESGIFSTLQCSAESALLADCVASAFGNVMFPLLQVSSSVVQFWFQNKPFFSGSNSFLFLFTGASGLVLRLVL